MYMYSEERFLLQLEFLAFMTYLRIDRLMKHVVGGSLFGPPCRILHIEEVEKTRELKHPTVNAIMDRHAFHGDFMTKAFKQCLTLILPFLPSWRVLDVSVAMAYGMLSPYGKTNRSISAAAAVLRGFNLEYPLTAVERQHLVLLVQCRLAASVTLGAYSFQQNPTNTYLLLHAEPAWKALEMLDVESVRYVSCVARMQSPTFLNLFFLFDRQACVCHSTRTGLCVS